MRKTMMSLIVGASLLVALWGCASPGPKVPSKPRAVQSKAAAATPTTGTGAKAAPTEVGQGKAPAAIPAPSAEAKTAPAVAVGQTKAPVANPVASTEAEAAPVAAAGQEKAATSVLAPIADSSTKAVPAAENPKAAGTAALAGPPAAEKALVIANQSEVLINTTEFKNVHFAFDEAIIRENDRMLLREYAPFFKALEGKKIVVEGHCDERGSAEYNLALGQRRADAVAKFLIALGIPQSTIATISYGLEKPLDKASTEEAWAKNRRAQFLIK